jgi:hypothetical protein
MPGFVQPMATVLNQRYGSVEIGDDNIRLHIYQMATVQLRINFTK